MLRILFLSLILFLAANSFAQEAVPPAVQTPAQPDGNYDCKSEQKKIFNDISEDVTCTHDEECNYFDYGYPWQPDICMKAIVNKQQEGKSIKNLALIEEYNQNCINNNDAEKKKFDEFAGKIETTDCGRLPRVYCYKGFCRTQSYAIYNDK